MLLPKMSINAVFVTQLSKEIKMEHYDMVKQCTNQVCAWNEKTCWYRHKGEKKSSKLSLRNEEIETTFMETDDVRTNLGFHKDQKIDTPPDMRNLIEIISRQVAKLLAEESGKTH